MFTVKNEHLIIYFFAFITVFVLLSNLTNETNGEIDQIYPKRINESYRPNERSYENLLDLMIEKFRENFIMTEVLQPVARYIQVMK